VQRWRLTLRRRADAPVVAQREWQAALETAVLASGLPVAVADGPGGRPRIAVAASLTQGIASEGELVELLLVRRLPVWQVREAIVSALPAGHELLGLEDVWLGEPAVAGRVIGAEYVLPLEAAAVSPVREAASALLAASALPRQRTRGDRTVDYDLRPFVDTVEVLDGPPATLRIRVRHDPEKGVGRPEEVLAELGGRVGVSLEPTRLVRTSLILAPLRTVVPVEKAPGGRVPGARPGAPGRSGDRRPR
jgi:radical SAM-linked protein